MQMNLTCSCYDEDDTFKQQCNFVGHTHLSSRNAYSHTMPAATKGFIDVARYVSCFPVIPAAVDILTLGNGTFVNMQQLFSENAKPGNSIFACM